MADARGRDWEIRAGDALERLRELPDCSVHCCVTSPPYWNLRDYGVEGQLGLEARPAEFVSRLVAVLAEVRRVLRDDGTLWLNLGDSYAGSWGAQGCRETSASTSRNRIRNHPKRAVGRASLAGSRVKPKDLVAIPWRVAIALCEDGWYLRSDTIEEVELFCPCGCGHVMEERIWRHAPDRELVWSKPNPMPESVTDRPTRSHEYLFLLSKSPRYYYDAEAIREPDSGADHSRRVLGGQPALEPSAGINPAHRGLRTPHGRDGRGRNKRSVWEIAVRPFAEAHFATFPPALVEPCLRAGTSARCCGRCGAPWMRTVERVVDHSRPPARRTPAIPRISERGEGRNGLGSATFGRYLVSRTTGWRPGCKHEDATGRAVVLDPFAGAATTGLVAVSLGRRFLGLELNASYVSLGASRIRRWEADPAGSLRGERPPAQGQLSLLDPNSNGRQAVPHEPDRSPAPKALTCAW